MTAASPHPAPAAIHIEVGSAEDFQEKSLPFVHPCTAEMSVLLEQNSDCGDDGQDYCMCLIYSYSGILKND
jgi:hypothetical protein